MSVPRLEILHTPHQQGSIEIEDVGLEARIPSGSSLKSRLFAHRIAADEFHPSPPQFGSMYLSPSKPDRPSRGPLALVIDPNPVTRHLVAGYLARAKCNVYGTDDPLTAMGPNAVVFDLIVVAAEIPGKTAMTLAQTMKRHRAKSVVVLAGPEVGDGAWIIGIDAIIQVPQGIARLGEIAHDLGRRLAEQAAVHPREPIDYSALEPMRTEDPATVREAIEVFIGQTPETIAQLADAARALDRHALFAACRRLSTSSRAMGASELAQIARTAGELGRQGDLEFISGFIDEIEREYMLVFRVLVQIHATIQG